MDNKNEKLKLNDELLDQVAGGDSVSGTTDKATCPVCQFQEPHPCTINYDFVDGKYVYETKITCGRCGAQIQ